MNHHPKEVLEVFIWDRLISNHQASIHNHLLFDPRGDRFNFLPPPDVLLLVPQTGWDEPEAHVSALPLLVARDQSEAWPADLS